MTDPEANDFLTYIIANETNKNHPELNITPDDSRVQEHAKKLEMCLGEMLEEKKKEGDV